MQNSKLKNSKIYGKELILDLYDCDPKIIRSKKKILEYLYKICNLIKVEKYGKPIIKRFGEKTAWGKGYSFFQFITASSITGHFLEPRNIAYINIFSCRSFDHKIAKNFTKEFFNARRIKIKVLNR